MIDTSHLVALHTGLMNEKARLASASSEQEIALRAVWVAQREKEIADECAFLGIDNILADETECDDIDLLAELLA